MAGSGSLRDELTPRAVLAGGAIGVVLACGNLYLGLKTGLWDAGWITAAILGFALLAPIGRLTGRALTPAENTVTLAVASSTAAMPSVMGLLGAIPALELLGVKPGALGLAGWAAALGGLGLWLALPLRAPLVEAEDLPFPSGRAAAEALSAAHAEGSEARRRARVLLAGAAAAAAFAVARDAFHLLPGAWLPEVALAGTTAAALQVGVSLSPMVAAGGVLVGPRVSLELAGGAILAWLVVGPRVVAGGTVAATYASLNAWLLWPGVAAMVASGVLLMALDWRTFGAFGRDLAALGRARALVLGVLAAAAVVIVAAVALDTSPRVAIPGVLMAVLFTGVFVRGFGQTDIAHYGAIGQLTQAGLGAVAPGAEAANIVGGSIAAGSAPQTVGLVTCFKIAKLVGARPGPLVAAHALGVVLGAAVIAPAYTVVARATGVNTAELPVPFAASWRALGAVAEHGLGALPPGATWAAAIAAGLAIAFTLGRRWRLAPSPLVVGLGFLLPISVVSTVLVGGLLAGAIGRRAPAFASRDLMPAAAGVIAGESVVGIVVALLIVGGWLS